MLTWQPSEEDERQVIVKLTQQGEAIRGEECDWVRQLLPTLASGAGEPPIESSTASNFVIVEVEMPPHFSP